ncbi:MAG: SH3 domain-containing protein [Deltaproteobacteria bacterium]|jgi:hypothetical protein|nr:SH3 domain-containing protein [Deltaproteobacteria bacterium]
MKYILAGVALVLFLGFGCVAPETDFSLTDAELCDDLRFLPQDLQVYIQSTALASAQDYQSFAQAELMTREQREKAMRRASANFFSPWVNAGINPAPGQEARLEAQNGSKSVREAMWGLFILKPEKGFAENLRPYPARRWEELVENSDAPSFPNSSIPSITVRNCDLRLLPTDSPYFFNPARPGQGYPFDLYQNSVLPIGSPVRIVHISKDKLWGFIEHASAMGWVRLSDLAEADPAFIASWRGKPLAAVLKDKALLGHTGPQGEAGEKAADALPPLLEDAGIGALLPYALPEGENLRPEEGNLTVYFPERGADGRARMLSCSQGADEAAPWPLPITRRNIALLGNKMLGQPYGWGGYGGNRDCSSLLRDLFLPFGLWLPRNSTAQIRYGKVTDLSGLSPQAKEQAILRQGKPFVSFIGMPGHIALYLGSYEGRAIIFHNLWGIRTASPSPVFGRQRTGRIVVGKAVVSTTSPGAEKENIAAPHSLLDRVTSLNYPLLEEE